MAADLGIKRLRMLLLSALLPCAALGQTLQPTPESTPAPFEETIVPTYETQKNARTYVLDIPAPRGQITDRNGAPLAQNKLGYNLAITYPTPLDFSDSRRWILRTREYPRPRNFSVIV